MKTDRLLSIVMTLINRRSTTAQALADQYEVSLRTIYRDIESLQDAGIPIEKSQGRNGGVHLAEGYRMDKTLLTQDELETVKAALKGIAGVLKSPKAKASVDKLGALQFKPNPKEEAPETLVVDLEPWGMEAPEPEEAIKLQQAAKDKQLVQFRYQAVGGREKVREVEPYAVIFKGLNWYLYGYCLERGDFRLFKILRMADIEVLKQTFTLRSIDIGSRPWDKDWHTPKQMVTVVLKIEKETYLSHQDYLKEVKPESFDKTHLVLKVSMPWDEGLVRFLLSFAGDVEVLGPPEVRKVIAQRAQKIFLMHEQ